MRFLFKERYTLTAQYAGSATSDMGDGQIRPLLYAALDRSGRTFSWQARFEDIHPEFQADSGFIRRLGDTQLFGSGQYTFFRSPGALLERYGFELRVDSYFDHSEFWSGATPYEAEIELQPSFNFRGSRSLGMVFRHGYFRFRPDIYSSYEVEAPDGTAEPFQVPVPLENMLAWAVFPRVRVNNALNLDGRVYIREVPIYTETSRGFNILIEPGLNLKPTTSLSFELSYTYSKLYRQKDDSVFSTSNIGYLRAQYQFSKALLARVIAQYNLNERDQLRDPTTGQPLLIDGSRVEAIDEGDFQGQVLVSYEPSPGTIVYVGYSFLREGINTYDISRMEPMADGLFVKFSYLFRF